MAACAGVSRVQMAQVLGISRDTLCKHYAHELEHGAAILRFELMDALFAAGMRGRVSALAMFLGVKRARPGSRALKV